ncbi:MAG TPA: low specificity L-threonine aldolase [Candidatus Udaeobacter sp.]
MNVDRQDFASDNTASICPEAWAALQEANINYAAAYGEDRWTGSLCNRIREIFEADCDVYFVFTGTAANALSLAQMCRSFRSIICHQNAHIQTDECGAPEFFTSGSKLLLVGGANGKIDIGQTRALLERQNDLHSHKPGAISVAQTTEFGTVYTCDQIAAIADLARSNELFLHLDGARFANAVAALNCAPKAITSDIGVDVLCFGGTKNGTAAGELVIFFNKEISRKFDYRLKQAGQLGSKMRFLAAQWLGLLAEDAWVRNARHANRMARQLAENLQKANVEIVFPVEANAVFARMDDHLVRRLQVGGWRFYKFIEPDIYRLMCSWATTESGIDGFIRDVTRNH